ncbi:hypothetical protein LINPERPRIM_LOCUS8048 [Linum perenne]
MFPHFLIHFEEVQLEYVSIALLSELGESFSPPDSPSQYHFHSLTLAEIDHPTILLPQGRFLQRLTCLQRLLIYGCNHLATLSLDILQRLPSLQKLSIVFSEALEFEDYDYGNDDDISLPVLPSLHHFYLRKLPKLVTLPKWLQHSFNMQQLDIYASKATRLRTGPTLLTSQTLNFSSQPFSRVASIWEQHKENNKKKKMKKMKKKKHLLTPNS